MEGAFLSILATTALGWLLAPFLIDWAWFLHPSTLIFVGAGLFLPAMGQILQIASIRQVGPVLTTAFGTFTPVFAIFVAILFLGEEVRPSLAIGLLLMIAGLVVSTLKGSIARGWPLWALLLPIAASLVRGVSQPVFKFGLNDLPSPFFATLIAASVSTLLLGAIMILRKPRIKTRAVDAASRNWFLFSGAVNGAGILSINAAVHTGAIALVSPLASTAPLFTLFYGWAIFRRETLTIRHLYVIALVMAGSFLVITG